MREIGVIPSIKETYKIKSSILLMLELIRY